jgi:hypothetical protein
MKVDLFRRRFVTLLVALPILPVAGHVRPAPHTRDTGRPGLVLVNGWLLKRTDLAEMEDPRA